MSRCVYIWFADALSGICYLYLLLCGAKSKMKEGGGGGKGGGRGGEDAAREKKE